MSFAPRIVYGAIDLTDSPYMVEFGFDLGRPVTVSEVVKSLLVDGSLLGPQGAGNRENMQLSVLAEGGDSLLLAQLGADLEVEAGKSLNTLTFYPGDGYGPAVVFDTFPAQVDHDWDQDVEQAGLRRFVLNIPALPFGHSVNPVTVTVTAPYTIAKPVDSTSGWTVVGAGAIATQAGGSLGGGATYTYLYKTTAGQITVKTTPTMALQDYLWIPTRPYGLLDTSGISSVTVGGIAVTNAKIRTEYMSGAAQVHKIPVPASLIGTMAEVQFTLVPAPAYPAAGAEIHGLATMGYPNKVTGSGSRFPQGIGVLKTVGSARAPAQISFTAPAGGAFLYTGPDPNKSLREKGLPENVFSHFIVTNVNGEAFTVGNQTIWFPPGTHSAALGSTPGQPTVLFPDGVWSAEESSKLGTTSRYAYPGEVGAAVTFYETVGNKNVLSPTATLPQGYQGDAVAHEVHSVWPGRMGIAVMDQFGAPIAFTLTYYPCWFGNAGQ